MNPTKFNNIFDKKELNVLNSIVNDIVIPLKKDGSYIYDDENLPESPDDAAYENYRTQCTISKSLGRLQFSDFIKDENSFIYKKVKDFIKTFSKDVRLGNILYVEYNNKYGTPNLPPHFDGDSSKFVVNFQLSSNTAWDLGIDFDIYSIEDNSALIFDPNKNIHWRPKKTFKDGEYVKMIFFRFYDLNKQVDNSHLRLSLNDKIFKNINDFRDSLVV